MSGSVLLTPTGKDQPYVRVCCHCRRIRGEKGWQPGTLPADRWVTHGICRDCYQIHYPEYGPPPGGD